MRSPAEPTYAVQMARPFWTLLRQYPQIPAALLEGTEAAPDDLRIPVSQGQQFLQYCVDTTGEPNLGLLAAREIKRGSFEVLEFTAFSAPTWRQASETGFRYARLMNEAADFRMEIEGAKAQFILHSTVPLTHAGIDFQSAAFYISCSRWFEERPNELEVWFTYPAPKDTSIHRATFDDAKLRFDAPWNGFVYDARRLDTPIASGDPSLHKTLREHADRLLAELAPGDNTLAKVRGLLLGRLGSGSVSAEDIAAQMGITRRTLTRRLGSHGTTFTEELEGVRRRAAVHYLTTSDHSVEDIAFLLGFSESSAFVRAFKRWLGVAPMAYRRSHRAR